MMDKEETEKPDNGFSVSLQKQESLLMKRLWLLLPLLLLGKFVFAQKATTEQIPPTFTQQLQEVREGEGTVVLVEDAEIDVLVNGPERKPPKKKRIREEISLGEDVAVQSTNKTYRNSYSVNGYRIQLYLGGDTREDRRLANAAGSKCKSMFPTLPVYTHFYSPHWICRVGDFRTQGEARAYLLQLRASGEFKQAAIVKCKIQVGY